MNFKNVKKKLRLSRTFKLSTFDADVIVIKGKLRRQRLTGSQ